MEIVKIYFVVGCICVIRVSACPQECMCFNQEVNCYGKNLYGIPSDIPEEAVRLDLGNNKIERIDLQQFANLSNLNELVLRYNRISTLEMKTFQYLTDLRKLYFGSNRIKILEEGAFEGLSNLKEIDLSENFIEKIEHVFDGLEMLERLDLGSNKIKTVDKMTFKDLKNLAFLLLPNNEIKYINRFAFHSLQKLTWITLTKNPLKNANALFSKNLQLSYVDLTQCTLTRVPSKLPPTIQYLLLGKNNITRIKANDFSRTKQLKILVLAQNDIDFIHKKAFSSLVNLQELRLTDNKLQEFPSVVPASVKSMYLSKNKIQKLSVDDFPDNSQLTTLSLKSNKISKLRSGTFSKLKNLNKLYLDENEISFLKDGTFSGLSKLSVLSLNKNPLTRLEKDVFFDLQSLSKLEMAFVPEVDRTIKIEGNIFLNTPSLSYLNLENSPNIAKQIIESDMLLSATNIKDINLMNNKLRTLKPKFRKFLKSADHVKLSGNMWHCDRRLLFFKKWMNSNLRKVFLSSQVTCYSPDTLKGKRISTLKNKEFVQIKDIPPEKLKTSTTMTTAIVSTVAHSISSKSTNTKLYTSFSKSKTITPTSGFTYSKNTNNIKYAIPSTHEHRDITKTFTTDAFGTSSLKTLIATTPNTNEKENEENAERTMKLLARTKVYDKQIHIKSEDSSGKTAHETSSGHHVQKFGATDVYETELNINVNSILTDTTTTPLKTTEKSPDKYKRTSETTLNIHPGNKTTKIKDSFKILTTEFHKIDRTTKKLSTASEQNRKAKTTANIFTERLSRKHLQNTLTTVVPKIEEQDFDANNSQFEATGDTSNIKGKTFSEDITKEISTRTFDTIQKEDFQTTVATNKASARNVNFKTTNPFKVTTVSINKPTEANKHIVHTFGTVTKVYTTKQSTGYTSSRGTTREIQTPNENDRDNGTVKMYTENPIMKPNSSSTEKTVVIKDPEERTWKFGTTVKVKAGTLQRGTENVRQSTESEEFRISTNPVDISVSQNSVNSNVTTAIEFTENGTTKPKNGLEFDLSATKTNISDKVFHSDPTQSVNHKGNFTLTSTTGRNKSERTGTVADDETYPFDTTQVGKNNKAKENNNNINGPQNTSGLPTDEDSIPREIPTTSGSDGHRDVIIVFTFISVSTFVVVVIMGLLVHRQYGRTNN